MKLSDAFIARLTLSKVPAYQLAARAGTYPAWLSRVIHGVISVEPGNPRVIKIGELLGLQPSECFKPGGEPGGEGAA